MMPDQAPSEPDTADELRVLVTAASWHGTTAEIARAIALTPANLRQQDQRPGAGERWRALRP
jgi:hypothetical protein